MIKLTEKERLNIRKKLDEEKKHLKEYYSDVTYGKIKALEWISGY